MLWDSIYQFFVAHVFGGFSGEDYYSNYLPFEAYRDGDWDEFLEGLGDFKVFINSGQDGYQYALGFGNYLALIATIITMVIIVTLCALFIVKIVKLIGGLIR